MSAASEVSSISDNASLNNIISGCKVVFSDELGTLKDFQADIPIDPQVIPKYFCARPVPHSLKEKIEHELEWLVKLGIYHPVATSKCLKGMAVFIFVAMINRLLIRQLDVTNTLTQKPKIFLLHSQN